MVYFITQFIGCYYSIIVYNIGKISALTVDGL